MAYVFDLSGRLSADVSPFNSAMDASANATDAAFQRMTQAAKTYLGYAGVAGSFYKVIQSANQFGQTVADIASITEDNFNNISNSLLRMDNVFGNTRKTGDSLYEVISSGIRGTTEEQIKFTEATSKVATTIRADLVSTTDAMTTLSNSYNLGIGDLSTMADDLFVLVKEGKAHGDDLARTLGLVINNAAESGIKVRELYAAIAILSRTQTTSQSMIGLNQMINSLIKPTLQAQAAARDWGIELSATRLQTIGLAKYLQELHDKVGGNVEALEKMFGNIRAGRAVLSLTGKQFENYIDVLNRLENSAGSSEEAFKKQTDTAERDSQRMAAQFDKTASIMGKDIESITRGLYGFGEAVMKGFGDASPISRYTVYIVALTSSLGLLQKQMQSLSLTMQGFHAASGASMTRGGLRSSTYVPLQAYLQQVQRQTAANTSVDPIRAMRTSLRPSVPNLRVAAEQNLALLYRQNVRGQWYDPNNNARFINYQRELGLEMQRLKASVKATSIAFEEGLKKRRAANLALPVGQRRDMYGVTSAERFERRYGYAPTLYGQTFGRLAQSEFGKMSGAIISMVGKVGTYAIGAIAAWDIGWNIGKAIAERFKFDESALIEKLSQGWVGAVAEWLTNWGEVGRGVNAPGSAEAKKALDAYNLAAGKANINRILDKGDARATLKEFERRRFYLESQSLTNYEGELALTKRLLSTIESRITAEKKYTEQVNNLRKEEADLRAKLAKAQEDANTKANLFFTKEQEERLTKLLSGKSPIQQYQDWARSNLTDTSLLMASERAKFDAAGERRTKLETATEAVKLGWAQMEAIMKQDREKGAGSDILGQGSARFTVGSGYLQSQVQAYDEAYNKANKYLLENRGNVDVLSDLAKGKNVGGFDAFEQKILQEAYTGLIKSLGAETASRKNKSIADDAMWGLQEQLNTNLLTRATTELNASIDKGNLRLSQMKQSTAIEQAEYMQGKRGIDAVDNLKVRMQDAQEKYSTYFENMSDALTFLTKFETDMRAYGFSKEQIQQQSEKARDAVADYYKKVQEASKEMLTLLDKAITEQQKDVEEQIKTGYMGAGINLDAMTESMYKSAQSIMTGVLAGLQKKLEELNEELKNTPMEKKEKYDAIKRMQQATLLEIEKQTKKSRDITADNLALLESISKSRASALGSRRERGAITGVEYQKEMRSELLNQIKLAEKGLAITKPGTREYDNALAEIERARTALYSFRMSVEDADIAVRSKMISGIQEFTSKQNKKGELTNDALYHSLNIMARLTAPQMQLSPQTSFWDENGKRIPAPTATNSSYKSAKDAQNKLSSSMDAYIMQQKYAESNMGKNVENIYNLLNQGKVLVVNP